MQELLGFSTDIQKIGFRLAKLEILNWGTFDKKIWKIFPDGQNSLLTGDIGSGKSTIVDAITTLIVPHHRITYNKAAGAESKERNLKTYIRGEFKNEKFEMGGSKAVYLRDDKCHSVILGHFANEGLSREVTLAQVFWINSSGVPDKFFVYSPVQLSIEEHFTKFGNSISDLKKRLKSIDKLLITDVFRDYSTKFRQEFGILNEKALELFYQTVSMKSVGNLTDFVRSQMLEQTNVKDKIDDLKKFYDDLNKAYNAVKKAKEQLGELSPLAKEIDEWERLEENTKELEYLLSLLYGYFAEININYLNEDVHKWKVEIANFENKLNEVTDELERLRKEETEIFISIQQDTAARRLMELETDIKIVDKNKTVKEEKYKEYKNHCNTIGLSYENKRDQFYENKLQLENIENIILIEKDEINKSKLKFEIKLHDIKKQGRDREEEIASLRKRKSLIPNVNLNIRQEISKANSIHETEIPFVGEILQVKESEKKWTAAIERLLYSFGLSILVSDKYYNKFSSYVNSHNLRGKIVFFRTVQSKSYGNPNKQSVATKLEIKSDADYYDWLDTEIKNRFGDYICSNSIEDFRNQSKAITIEGLIKHGQNKHEKDDRTSILDSTKFILGWSNQEKIDALDKELDKLIYEIQRVGSEIENCKNNISFIDSKLITLRDLKRLQDFTEINWEEEAIYLQNLIEEKINLENSSDQLKELKGKESKIKSEIIEKSETKDSLTGKLAVLYNNMEKNKVEISKLQIELDLISLEDRNKNFPILNDRFGNVNFTRENILANEKAERKKIEIEIRLKEENKKKIRDSIIRKMKNYSDKYKEETIEVDSTIESRNEYKNFLRKIEEEDLPKHEERFRKELNENTIQNILTFKNELENYASDIESKINEINKSLKEIEYNLGTYIQIVAEKTDEGDIRDFKEMLRNSLERIDSDEEAYSEKIFFRVKEIIDRFNSGDRADIDWTNRVTDVKNWFKFIVDESYIATNEHKERYADSGGKSGGQKEKLAYTILASALAYQFGLKFDKRDDRSFRFVVIDEAFGRGSDESTRYGLELFKKLNLQLLIVTPLQKINIIEDYISTVHFVSNTNGNNSVVRDLTITDYKAGKKEFQV
jgi:uncharacterized protein YPO0396